MVLDGLGRLILKHLSQEEGFTFFTELHADYQTLNAVYANSDLLLGRFEELELSKAYMEGRRLK